MRKKTSILLAGLFAVSGILPCYAEDRFFMSLGPWSDRGSLLSQYNLSQANMGGRDWSNTTKLQFKSYTDKVKEFQEALSDFKTMAAAVTGQAYLKGDLPNDGTHLNRIREAATGALAIANGIDDRSVKIIMEEKKTIDELVEALKKKIDLARNMDINISNLAASNNESSNTITVQSVG